MAVINFRLLSKGPTVRRSRENFFELEHDRSGGRHLRFRFDPDPRPGDSPRGVTRNRDLSIAPGEAFEGGGDRRADLCPLVDLAVAAEEADAREVSDDRAGYRDRDDRDLAAKATAVSAHPLGVGRARRSLFRCSICYS